MKKILFIFLTFTLLSCDSWLNYSPYDKIEGDKLYSTEEGAQKALNGLYLNLLNTNLYSADLTCSLMDVFAQLYYTPKDHAYQYYGELNYTEDKVKSRIGSIWKALYKAIADCNIFLEQIEKNKDLYTPQYYDLYRGEALALRTFLHLDAFRIFGPVGSDYMIVMENKYIPYYEEYSPIPTPYLTGIDFMDLLQKDIDEAIGLLREDPILTQGVVSGDGFWNYRNFRMNKYAALVLKARLCLHSGDRDNANIISTSLLNNIDPDTKEGINFIRTFPTAKEIPSGAFENVFFSEIIFGMQNTKREDIYKDYFGLDLSDAYILKATTSFINPLYAANDLRGRAWTDADVSTKSFSKFQTRTVSTNDRYEPYRYQIQSLIRLGEVYLIAAESSDNDAEKKEWLKKLRITKGMQDTNMDGVADIQQMLLQENIREFYGEGQYFFFLKRNLYSLIPSNNNSNGIVMTTSKYELPIPDAENDNR